ncbi:hypothetical protein PACTADRAFT_51844 [Pachysolen tannophilus NRRL Y-2460]|uniref:Zn(2)-C6 fungal-type domain-containing protein n=1 Tax=Pachysolen tannophilus NRRL Y-2460 TaxID=669874 RepID=A0A1E4TN79_PACTA|nr:hypothetical protein PACTADRAFT_51844 [Pachysolen tannophilus NRRL Y-2460]
MSADTGREEVQQQEEGGSSLKRLLSKTNNDGGSVVDEKNKKPKQRRNRRSFSCAVCKKYKTRCDFEIELGKCHRCYKLRLDCSLSNELQGEINQLNAKKLSQADEKSDNLSDIINRLSRVEENVHPLTGKIDLILNLLDEDKDHNNKQLRKLGKNTTATSLINPVMAAEAAESISNLFSTRISNDFDNIGIGKSNSGVIPFPTDLNINDVPNIFSSTISNSHDKYLDKYASQAPLNVIKNLDKKLFNRVSKYDPLKLACKEFLDFYFANEQLCLDLAKSFLEISHFWIIPGGLKELDRSYVIDHPFITCVFVTLAMCFDENYNYVEEQKKLYSLTTKLLGIALVTDPLTDQDIEAILYLSLYNISRKPKQPQIDNWFLASAGIKHFMLSLNFNEIRNRVVIYNRYENFDIYRLRVWNSLCACYFQASIGYGRPVMLSKEYFDIHQLTLKFPNATIGDAIKVAELELNIIVLKILDNLNYYFENIKQFDDIKKDHYNGHTTGVENVLTFKELDYWKLKWDGLIKRDISSILLFSYNFFYVMLSRRYLIFIEEAPTSPKIPTLKDFKKFKIYNTCYHHSIMTLQRFLELPSSIIKGSPTFSLNQIVYACMTLCDIMKSFKNAEFYETSINLITKIYWNLTHIGEKKNDATDTVGRIIKNLVDDTKKKHDQAEANDYNDDISNISPLDNIKTSPNNPVYESFNAGNSSSSSSQYHFRSPSSANLNSVFETGVPDVSQFDSFEDFFSGIFK